jgi:predicted phage terminase large subunit-like protein
MLNWDDMTAEERAGIKVLSNISPLTFMRAWFQLVQGQKMLLNWHHRYMDWSAEKILSGEWKNVVFNMPPGGTKTEFWSIHLPAYCMVKFDSVRILNTSYSKALVEENSNRTKGIIKAAEFRALWPHAFGRDQVDNWTLADSKGAIRHQMFSRPSGGQITGVRGGHMREGYSGHVMMDDWDKPEDMFSETKRIASHRRATNTLRSRRATPDTPILCIQQRLHVHDISGFLLSGEMGLSFDHVIVPALVTEAYIEALPEKVRAHAIKDVMGGKSITMSGERYWSYWPAKESVDDLVALWERDEYTFLSQYQQRPKSIGGNLLDVDWFPRYKQLPPLKWRGVYVDTAQKTKEHNDYSVFLYCGVGEDDNLYIIDVCRGKWEAWQLEQKALECWALWKPWDIKRPAVLRYMKVEDKSSGTGLIQTIRKKGAIPIVEVPRGPEANKLTRCMDIQPWVKAGRVRLPALHTDDGTDIRHVLNHRGDTIASTDWVLPFLAEASGFAADMSHDFDDQCDTLFDAVADAFIEGGGRNLSSWM